MSTKLEELSDTSVDENEEVQNIEELEEDLEEELEEDLEEGVDIFKYSKVLSNVYESVKEPLLVSIVSLTVNNSTFKKMLNSLPYLNVSDKPFILNLVLALITGVLFLVLRLFV